MAPYRMPALPQRAHKPHHAVWLTLPLQGLPQAFLGEAMLDRRITFADLMADNGLPSGSREPNAIYPDRRPKYNRKS